MEYRKSVINIVIVCIFSIMISVVLGSPEIFGLCEKGDMICVRKFIHKFDNIIQVIFYFAIVTTVALIGVYFAGVRSFNAWKKFAMVYLPISFILIAITPTTGGFMMPDSEMISLWLAGLFFIISIIIILVKREKHGVLEEEEC